MKHPKIRPIEAFPVETSGKQSICIRDPQNFSENVLLVPYNAFFIISLFDGNHSILDIQTKYSRQYGGDLLLSDNVHQIIKELDNNLFMENDRFKDHVKKIKDGFKNSNIRKAIHAGAAYEGNEEKLRSQLDTFFTSSEGPGLPATTPGNNHTLKGIIAPHIDLRCGGPCFAWAYKELAETSDADTFIILGIAHSGAGNLYALTNKTFETPFGPVEADKDFIQALEKKIKFDFYEDEFIHKNEHSIEFQLIFLQYLYQKKKDFKIVPILCSSFGMLDGDKLGPKDIPQLNNFITSLKETIESSNKEICVIASVDLAHVGQKFGDNERQDETFLKKLKQEDLALLKFAENMDAHGFYHSLQKCQDKRKICGYPAIYTMLNTIDASKGKLLKYAQNTDHNTQSTVTFTSMSFHK